MLTTLPTLLFMIHHQQKEDIRMAIEEIGKKGSKPVMSMKKHLWNLWRIVIFMARRGVLKHRRLLKMVGKNLGGSIMFHQSSTKNALGVEQYEFSCSSSPEHPSGFQIRKRKQLHHYLPSLSIPCMHSHPQEKEEMEELKSNRYVIAPMLSLLDMRKEFISRDNLEACQFNGGDEFRYSNHLQVFEEWGRGCSSSLHSSSRWSIHEGEEGLHQVDKKAEEFIAKVYNEMELERQFSFCQYREMLARGTS